MGIDPGIGRKGALIVETQEMGRVTTEAILENIGDLWEADQAKIPATDVRRVTVADALVDTGATLLSLPTRYIQQLGLTKTGQRRVTSSTGRNIADMYSAVR